MALEKMTELRIDLRRESSLEALDRFRNFAEPLQVALRIAAAGFVGNDGEAVAEGGGELG
jgi:hypothetical protein